MSGIWKRVRMRRLPFGALSSLNSLAFGSMMGPSADREAPHANSPVAIGIWARPLQRAAARICS